MAMKRLKVSKGGQVSIPATVRHRWRTKTVVAEDQGDRLVLRPVPDDPVAAAMGSLREYVDRPIEEARDEFRREEADLQADRLKRSRGASA